MTAFMSFKVFQNISTGKSSLLVGYLTLVGLLSTAMNGVAMNAEALLSLNNENHFELFK